MENYFYKKENATIEILDKIKENLVKKKSSLKKAFELDKEEWDILINIEKLSNIIEEIKKTKYLPKISKKEIVNGIGKVGLISNQNPYVIFSFALSCIYTNNSVEIALERKMKASNIAIIELIKKSLEELNYDSNIVNYIEVLNKEEFIQNQDKYDLLYYLGNKEEYLKFIKRIHIDSKYENFAEIYIYIDNDDFQNSFNNIDKFAYENEIKVQYFHTDFEKSIKEINKNNNINKWSVIFTKDTEKAYEFIKQIKSENVYININPCDDFNYQIDLNNLVFTKKVKIK